MSNKWSKKQKAHLFKGKGEFKDCYLVYRNTTAAVFSLDKKVITSNSIADVRESAMGDEIFYDHYMKDFSSKWTQIHFDEELVSKFIIRIEYFLLWQKEYEYLGFFLPMPRVIFRGFSL